MKPAVRDKFLHWQFCYGEAEFGAFRSRVFVALVAIAVLTSSCEEHREHIDIGDHAPGYAEACRSIKNSEIIDAAIGWFVRRGKAYDERADDPGTLEVNPYPYTTIEDFKTKNPECCQILSDIPGDYLPQTQEYGKLKDGYRSLFAVRIDFMINTTKGFVKEYELMFVNCFGKLPLGIK